MTLDDKIKQLMQEHPDLFPTEAKFWAYLRGALRRGLWEKSPMKHRYKATQMLPPPEGYTGRGKKGSECALEGDWTMTSKLEVDHKDGNKSLRSEDDILPFIIHLLASNGDELQLVGKEAHRIKSYADRHGLTYEQAVREKEVIAFSKLTAQTQRAKLIEMGASDEQLRTAKNRKNAYRELLK